MFFRILVLILLFLTATRTSGQTQGDVNGAITMDYEAIRLNKVVHAVRMTEKVKLDGKLDEAAWLLAEPATDFIQWEPNTGAPARDRTEARFIYDDEHLYVGITCWDRNVGDYVIKEMKEDFASTDSDGVSVMLDTLHDRRSAFTFGTNPAGARRDMQITADGAQQNNDWDGVWDVRVGHFEEGYVAEFMIPFKTLRFSKDNVQEWGVNMLRRVRRTNEDSNWAPVPRRYRATRVSAAGTLKGLEGIQQGRNLKFKPYVTGGLTQTRSDEQRGSDFDADGGMDLKYSLTPAMTLDLTYRTEFSQVEVDQQQVNLTRFNVLFPEKREFFLENAGTFNFGGTGAQNMIPFFSRRIGLNATGTPIPIIGGSRVSGKIGSYDLGFIAMKTRALGTTPANNFVVGRIKRNLLKNSWIGGLITSRDSAVEDDYNRVYGADARFQFWDKLDFDASFLRSDTPRRIGENLAGRFEAGWRADDLTIAAEFETIQKNFVPEMGFIRRRDNAKYAGEFSWRPRPRVNRIVRYYEFATNYEYFKSNITGKVETRNHNINIGVNFQNSSTFDFSTSETFDRLVKPFEIRTDLSVPTGDYVYRNQTFSFNSNRGRPVYLNTSVNFGEFWNGRKTTLSGGGGFNPHHSFNVTLNYNFNRVRLGQGRFTTKLAGTRVLYAFSSRAFLNAFFQYNADTRQMSSNIRLNIIHRPMSDLYVVYNDRRDRVSGQLIERAFIVKVTNLFNF